MVLRILLVILLLVGCNFDLEDEGKLKRTASIKITYHGLKFHDIDLKHNRTSRAITGQEQLIPVYHFIAVEPDVDILWLDNDMTAEVLVPLDTPLWVTYMNWTEEQPDIYYKFGVSEEFIVTKDSPERIKIWIDTEINPDYPFEEEETTDNETDITHDEDIVEEEEQEEEFEEEIEETELDEEDTSLLFRYDFNTDCDGSYGTYCFAFNSGYWDGGNLLGSGITWPGKDDEDGPSEQYATFDGTQWFYTEQINSQRIGTSDNWTISFWIKPDLSDQDMDEWHSVLSTGDLTSSSRFQIDFDGTDKLRFYGILKADLDDDEWQFFTFTKTTDTSTGDNQKVRMYKNAELVTYGYPISTRFDKLKIGMNRLGGGGWFGAIDDIRVYTRPLDVDEIEELYESYDYE